MGLNAKIGLGFLIVLGIFIAVVIFGNSIALPAPHIATLENQASVESALLKTAPEETRYINPATSENANVTKDLASIVSKDIINRNPEGPQAQKLSVPDAALIAQKALEESTKNFDPSYFNLVVRREEIIINNTQDADTYRAATRQIIADIENNFYPKSDAPLKDRLNELAKLYENAARDLRALSVPETLAPEHQKIISMVIGKERILETAADYENDPIRAMLALKLWETTK